MDIAERVVDLTTSLVAFPTHEAESEAQTFLAEVLEAAGFSCELDEVAPRRPNLVAQRGEGGTFFCSHIDTHPPHGHPDPHTCRQVGELLVGRGVLDAKGQIAALVAAVEAERDAPALVAITCDEEAGGLGSERLSLPDGAWRSQGGVVLEPTNFAICTAQAGNIDVRAEVSAPPAHAYASTDVGSPVTAVLAVIEELDTCQFLRVEHPLLGRPRTNIGRVRGGEHMWRTPARASLEMTLGVVPGTDLAEAETEVRTRIDTVARRWGERGTSFLYEILDTSEPIELPVDVPIASLLARAQGQPFAPAGMPSWTDAGNLWVKHGVPCVVFGAGDLAPAHSNQEWVAANDLVRLSDVLRRLLSA